MRKRARSLTDSSFAHLVYRGFGVHGVERYGVQRLGVCPFWGLRLWGGQNSELFVVQGWGVGGDRHRYKP